MFLILTYVICISVLYDLFDKIYKFRYEAIPMVTDPFLPTLVGISLVILLMGMVLRRFSQPYVIAYILVGIVIGKHGLGFATNDTLLQYLGSIGVVLLLFFVGLEVSLPKLLSSWKVPVLGTLCQLMLSIGMMGLLGYALDWPLNLIILLGFVISLSSTSIVVSLLKDAGEFSSVIGRNVLGVLVTQDLAVIPMMIILNLLSGQAVSANEISLQIIGGIMILGLIVWVTKNNITLPEAFKHDHEAQVFGALFICFGLALFTGAFGISTALGSFVAGILISTMNEASWVKESLHPFKILFVALFFVSIGMLINLDFFAIHYKTVLILVGLVLLFNTLTNAIVFHSLGSSWKDSVYSGALLSQIGEFSFVLGAAGLSASIVTDFSYQMIVLVISFSMLFSPLWIMLMKKLTAHTFHKKSLPLLSYFRFS